MRPTRERLLSRALGLFLGLSVWSGIPATGSAEIVVISVEVSSTIVARCEAALTTCTTPGTACAGGRVCSSWMPDGEHRCLGPQEIVCCDPLNTPPCPSFAGLEGRCITTLAPEPGFSFEGGAWGLCVYDVAGSTACRDQAAAGSTRVALACFVDGDISDRAVDPVPWGMGDCDLDGIPNADEMEPCASGVMADGGVDAGGAGLDAGPGGAVDGGAPTGDAGGDAAAGVPGAALSEFRFHGGGGCSVRGGGERRGTGTLPVLLVAVFLLRRRRT